MSEETKPKRRGRPPKVVELIQDSTETPLKAFIVGTCNNPTWVKGRIDGFSVNVKCPAQLSKRLIGKEVNVILVNSEPEDYYQYTA